MNQSTSVEPFLRWAGGKRWFAADYLDCFPPTYNNYIEPFLGSAAVFFSVAPRRALLSDINGDLIDCYRAVQSNWKLVVRYLKSHQRQHGSEYYYHLRDSMPLSLYSKAARFVYLNRTCWNGLYRVNRLGRFNVPIGTKSNVLLDTDDFKAVAAALSGATIESLDFEQVVDGAGEHDLLFVDPPYTAKHNHNGFVKYNEKLFLWEDQIRLRNSLLRAKRRGAYIVMTNADHPSIRRLYSKEFRIHVLPRYSGIAASSKHRRPTTELLITGHE